jgi:predicted XRE-type DNA-binding protein
MKKVIKTEETIITKILLIRNQKVMIDADLAELYGVTTKRLNEQVKRNINRFPFDFMFQLLKKRMRWSQIATTSKGLSFRQHFHMLLLNMEP